MGEGRVSQAEANYRRGSADKACALCTMFRPPGSCTKVAGEISPRGVCDYFERKGATIAGAKR